MRPLAHGAGWLLAVADGISGAPAGERASALVMRRLTEADGPYSAALLETVLQGANEALYHAGREDHRLLGMGTTVTVAQIRGGELLLAHVGDSRAYRLRGDRIEQLTHDHAVAAELYGAGQLSAEDAATHPLRHVLTRAIGPWHSVRVDLSGLAWEPQDRLILCTDGLSGVLTPDAILAVCRQASGETAVQRLVEAALAGGALDDVTVVLAEDQRGVMERGYGR